MLTIFAINAPEADKLAEVVAIMREMGAPKIRALWCGDHWRAIEGSHRIAAAAQLGLVPEIVEVAEGDEIADHDIGDLPEVATVAEIVEYMGQGVDYSFRD